MAFLHSVMGDNTPENREHLEKVGYGEIDKLSCPCLSLITNNSGAFFASPMSISNRHNIINCIGNPQLFKAVSAMRNDSDYLQWFTNDKCDEWLLCKKENYQDFVKLNVHVNFYKATLSELEAHFQRV